MDSPYDRDTKFLITKGRAVSGKIVRARSFEDAAMQAYGKFGVDPKFENKVTVYLLGHSQVFYPVIEEPKLKGVEEAHDPSG